MSPFTSVRYAERKRWRTGVRVLLVLVVVAAVGAGAIVASLFTYAATTLSGVPVTELARVDDGVENTLVVTREADGTAGSIAIVQTSEGSVAPRVLLFPVDLEVQVLGAGTKRLGQFLQDGGIALLTDAVQRFTDDGDGVVIALDHYVVVDLDGLAALVTELGGVPDCAVPRGELCGTLAPGRVTDLLARTGTTRDDDPERAREIHQVVRNLAAEIDAQTGPTSPLRTKRMIDLYVEAIETDRDLGPRSWQTLADAVVTSDPAAAAVRVIPGTRQDGIVVAAPEKTQELFAAFADPGQPLPEGAAVEAPRALTPADVSVRVLNGVGTSGLAAEVADFLRGKGFIIESTDNADLFDSTRATEIAHGPEGAERAELVASYFPGATVRELPADRLPTGVHVVVTVGGDWGRA